MADRDEKGWFLPGNQIAKMKRKDTPNILALQDKVVFEKLADWAERKILEGDEKFNTALYLSLVGKCSAVKDLPEKFDLGKTQNFKDIDDALEKVIKALADGEITHAEAESFEKRLASKFSFLQAALQMPKENVES